MKIMLNQITTSSIFLNNLDIYKQFTIHQTVNLDRYEYHYLNNYQLVKEKVKICDIVTTNPTIKIGSFKIINTLQGTSLEGQKLTGKALVIIGSVPLNILVKYNSFYNNNLIIKNVNIPFSEVLVIPNDFLSKDCINLRYLIEDVSLGVLDESNLIVSVTAIIQLVDKLLHWY